MSLYVIGVDPGISGGIAMVGPHALRLVDWEFMPYTLRAGGKHKHSVVDAVEADRVLKRMVDRVPGSEVLAVIERVSAMPRQGVSSSFNFGHNAGVIEAVLRLKVGSVSVVSPGKWKRDMRLSADKQKSLAMARDMFGPMECFRLKTKDGVAEAALLASYWIKHNNLSNQ